MKENYQLKLDRVLKEEEKKDRKSRLLLHACCAPCSSYVLEYLSPYFDITVYYYNPNISTKEEYDKRVAELIRLLDEMPAAKGVHFLEGPYEPEVFFDMAKGYEDVPEGGERCFRCYELRLRKTADMAQAGSFDFFTTTLSISPLKNADKLNEIGQRLSREYGVSYLPSDFKKRNGYLRSIGLSKEYHLYRQNYCGCGFSKRNDM